jgi:hypothetical protein
VNCPICAAPLLTGALFCGECGSSAPVAETRKRTEPAPGDTTAIVPLTPTASVGAVPAVSGLFRPEPTGVPAVFGESAPRFVLRFSTGQIVMVQGTGLLGRQPRPQAQEMFDHLVQVEGAGRAVSKTHLEFGQENGEFWVRDRFSGNGSAIVTPHPGGETASPVRCEPGLRYFVPRGHQVNIAQDSFTVT